MKKQLFIALLLASASGTGFINADDREIAAVKAEIAYHKADQTKAQLKTLQIQKDLHKKHTETNEKINDVKHEIQKNKSDQTETHMKTLQIQKELHKKHTEMVEVQKRTQNQLDEIKDHLKALNEKKAKVAIHHRAKHQEEEEEEEEDTNKHEEAQSHHGRKPKFYDDLNLQWYVYSSGGLARYKLGTLPIANNVELKSLTAKTIPLMSIEFGCKFGGIANFSKKYEGALRVGLNISHARRKRGITMMFQPQGTLIAEQDVRHWRALLHADYIFFAGPRYEICFDAGIGFSPITADSLKVYTATTHLYTGQKLESRGTDLSWLSGISLKFNYTENMIFGFGYQYARNGLSYKSKIIVETADAGVPAGILAANRIGGTTLQRAPKGNVDIQQIQFSFTYDV